MPKSITLYGVFVASPSDVKEERESLQEVINEINLTTAKNLGIKLELVRWETHTYPNFGVDPQDVINNQIPDDYDIFIGIMWSKFGTPTSREDSGTKEEFMKAYERWARGNQQEMILMFYFKNAPIMIEQIDLVQILFLKGFKQELGPKGGLYWEYRDTEEFKNFVRIYLNLALTNLVKQNNGHESNQITISSNSLVTVINNEEIEEIGILDLYAASIEKLNEINAVIENITRYVSEYTDKTVERTMQLNRLVSASESTRIRETKRIVDNAAEDLTNLAERTAVEIPIFKGLYEEATRGLSTTYTIVKKFDVPNHEENDNVRNTLFVLKSAITRSTMSTLEFRDVIGSMSNSTANMNKAQKKSNVVLNELIKELEFASQLINKFGQNN